jgi:hypothetical protein
MTSIHHDLIFIRNMADEEYAHRVFGANAEVALWSIEKRAREALSALRELDNENKKDSPNRW